jgi:hypothetical protein
LSFRNIEDCIMFDSGNCKTTVYLKFLITTSQFFLYPKKKLSPDGQQTEQP